MQGRKKKDIYRALLLQCWVGIYIINAKLEVSYLKYL